MHQIVVRIQGGEGTSLKEVLYGLDLAKRRLLAGHDGGTVRLGSFGVEYEAREVDTDYAVKHLLERSPVQTVSPAEFARTHKCDADWLGMMTKGKHQAIVLTPGQRGSTSGLPCTVIGHYANGMYDVRVPGGEICISALEFAPD